MTERSGSGHLDVADVGGGLVEQADFALERTGHRGNSQLHIKLISIGGDFGHRLAAGNAAGQHLWIVEPCHTTSTGDAIVSVPLISSFMRNLRRSGQQPGGEPAIDGATLGFGEASVGNDLKRREIAIGNGMPSPS